LAFRSCTICGRHFRPDPRARCQQRCCSRRCSRKLKRQRDRVHKQRYRDTGLGKEQRRRESEKRREAVGWDAYMRAWRKAEPEERARCERDRARRYYDAHREEILAKRRRQRAEKQSANKSSREACSH